MKSMLVVCLSRHTLFGKPFGVDPFPQIFTSGKEAPWLWRALWWSRFFLYSCSWTSAIPAAGMSPVDLSWFEKKKKNTNYRKLSHINWDLGAYNPGFIDLRKGFNRRAYNLNIKALRNKLWQCWSKYVLHLFVFELQNAILNRIHVNTYDGPIFWGGGRGLLERFHSSGQRLCKFIGKKKAFTWEKISTPRCFL